jgi:hypothetical protein
LLNNTIRVDYVNYERNQLFSFSLDVMVDHPLISFSF